jgi:hypothetical protein
MKVVGTGTLSLDGVSRVSLKMLVPNTSEPDRKFRSAPTHNPSFPRKRESRGRDPSAGPGPPLSPDLYP